MKNQLDWTEGHCGGAGDDSTSVCSLFSSKLPILKINDQTTRAFVGKARKMSRVAEAADQKKIIGRRKNKKQIELFESPQLLTTQRDFNSLLKNQQFIEASLNHAKPLKFHQKINSNAVIHRSISWIWRSKQPKAHYIVNEPKRKWAIHNSSNWKLAESYSNFSYLPPEGQLKNRDFLRFWRKWMKGGGGIRAVLRARRWYRSDSRDHSRNSSGIWAVTKQSQCS